jgi:hypothetical protein
MADLPFILQVTEQEIEKRKEGGFAFWRCEHCGSDLFHLESDRGVWCAVCNSCSNEYQILWDWNSSASSRAQRRMTSRYAARNGRALDGRRLCGL